MRNSSIRGLGARAPYPGPGAYTRPGAVGGYGGTYGGGMGMGMGTGTAFGNRFDSTTQSGFGTPTRGKKNFETKKRNI